MTSHEPSLSPLERAFGAASPEHFEWATRAPYVATRERDLVARAFLPLGQRVLDVGCGEGATLVHLGAPEGAVGVDLFEPKLAYARAKLPGCRFVRASATDLPFDDASFDHVILRDVVHHLERPELLAFELRRVLEAGGRLDVLEPCRANPLVFLHALALPVERGELRMTPNHLRRLFAPQFSVERVEHLQALPIHRVVFHPRFGLPALARLRPARLAVAAIEQAAERVVPRAAFAYLHLRARASDRCARGASTP